jgi:CDP-glycerol glycerophosphotransferase
MLCSGVSPGVLSSLGAVPRPRLSVVLAVFREQAYLQDCVSSLLGQPYRDVELVAVDNASPDHGPEILDELASRDDRLAVHRLESPVDLGRARNLALESAAGDYVWFVAATDRVPTGALAAVAERLDETEADVLVVGHTRSGPLGGARPGPYQEVLRAAPAGESFTLEEYPAALELGAGLRDKIFSLAFLRAHGLRFAPARYGHLSMTYPALLLADRIGVLPRVCYERYDPPNAADEAHVHGTPFDVFGQYDALFRWADSQSGRLAAQRPSLAEHMLRHYLAILPELPRSARREFQDRMSESYRRHAGRPSPGRRQRGVGRVASRRGEARRRLAGLRRPAGKAARVARRKALRLYYRTQLRAPIEPDLAVFAAYWYRSYSCNPRAVYEKLRELVPNARAVWVIGREHISEVPADVEHVVAGTRAYYRLIARAKYFVNNVNFPNELVKREGTIHVQTHHGTPLKTMGLDQRDSFVAGAKRDFAAQLRRTARWDYSISSNAFSTLVWERAYPTRYETLEVGYPRNDVLVNATEAEVERIRKELGIPSGRRTILFAPTHREYLPRYVPTADIGRLSDELGPDYVIMMRVHYFYGDFELELQRRAGRVLDVTRHPAVEDLCLAADVLVTDYSSIMFDYAVLDRPIVVHAPDWDVYRTLRGTYFDLLAEPPGVVTATDDELIGAFRSGAVWSERSAALRTAFRARFCSLEDGRAAERVVRRVWLSERDAGRAREPMRPPRATIEA